MPIHRLHESHDLRSKILPAGLLSLFNDRFIRSCDLIEEYIFRLALGVVRQAGLVAPLAKGGTATEIAIDAGLDPLAGPWLTDWLLRLLTERGVILCRNGIPARFQISNPLPDLDPIEIEKMQASHDATALPSFQLATLAAEGYPRVMRGESSGESILFTADRLAAWAAYFSNKNPLYAISNEIGARAVQAHFPHPHGAILEIGGGFGSGAMTLLDRFDEAGAATRIKNYHFTEYSPIFLRRGQRALMSRPNARGHITCARLDINRPFAEAHVEPASLSVVYGVNTLHVAHDLAFTLREIYTALAPGGLVVASECIRPFPAQTVYVEFIFALLASFRSPALQAAWRPNGGFLTPEQWIEAFKTAGFKDSFVWPDIANIRDHYPAFVVAVVGATRP
ncbi:MAG TPA: class I SAM-dependent methyltransferase [Candidatus Competibacteraceae bacterium]|nr:class I SAM-dependent methyltransferase [Candidatus Competibacteraceae bacterium]